MFKRGMKNIKTFLENLTVSLFIGYVLSMVILFPINKYNFNNSLERNNVDIIYCELESITKTITSKGFYFKFKNEIHFVKDYLDIFTEIERKNNYEDYHVQVGVSKGILNSYIIDSYIILSK
jgi:hypothetical protein